MRLALLFFLASFTPIFSGPRLLPKNFPRYLEAKRGGGVPLSSPLAPPNYRNSHFEPKETPSPPFPDPTSPRQLVPSLDGRVVGVSAMSGKNTKRAPNPLLSLPPRKKDVAGGQDSGAWFHLGNSPVIWGQEGREGSPLPLAIPDFQISGPKKSPSPDPLSPRRPPPLSLVWRTPRGNVRKEHQAGREPPPELRGRRWWPGPSLPSTTIFPPQKWGQPRNPPLPSMVFT